MFHVLFIQATNQHNQVSIWSLLDALFTLLLAWAFGSLWQAVGVVFAMLLAEFKIVTACISYVKNIFLKQKLHA